MLSDIGVADDVGNPRGPVRSLRGEVMVDMRCGWQPIFCRKYREGDETVWN
jgi:hypothetical protein